MSAKAPILLVQNSWLLSHMEEMKRVKTFGGALCTLAMTLSDSRRQEAIRGSARACLVLSAHQGVRLTLTIVAQKCNVNLKNIIWKTFPEEMTEARLHRRSLTKTKYRRTSVNHAFLRFEHALIFTELGLELSVVSATGR